MHMRKALGTLSAVWRHGAHLQPRRRLCLLGAFPPGMASPAWKVSSCAGMGHRGPRQGWSAPEPPHTWTSRGGGCFQAWSPRCWSAWKRTTWSQITCECPPGGGEGTPVDSHGVKAGVPPKPPVTSGFSPTPSFSQRKDPGLSERLSVQHQGRGRVSQ